ncbi:MAG: Do family serine endopeptidase [Candidatus Omnitrophica bacterium]|nr:Do family serine endopeptidase [Candidatus Omnitrophota bacterium]
MNRRVSRAVGAAIATGVVVAGVLVGRGELWSSSAKSPQGGMIASAAQTATSEGESLQGAFMRIAQQAGPAVVSISTEQIERVRAYFRGHPFFGPGGDDPFDEFFRQFYGQMPERELRRFGLGSGVIIDERGFILTNEHVVANADKITITLADGRESTGTVKGKDPRSDLAVVKIDGKKLAAAKLGDSSTVQTGQWAVALGNPFGLVTTGPSARAGGAEPTLTVGVVSALNRQLPRGGRYDRDYTGLIQTDAAINPGNSGGPLLNLRGEVIGINVAILTSSRGFEGVGFAIPVNKAKMILESLIEGRRIIYGWLGIQIQDITADVAEYYGLAEQDGVLVYQVLPESPASKAGIRDGDIIKSYGGSTIKHSRELIERVSATKAGQKVAVELLREGKPQTVQVEIGERPADVEGDGTEEAGGEAWRGMQVAAITQAMSEQFNVEPGTAGVVVVEVAPNSPADQAGLRPGDVINEINRVRIQTLGDYQKVIAQVRGNALIRTTRGYVVLKAGE